VKKKKKSLYAPLTRDELFTIKETESLYRSGLFRMQIDELLKEVKLKKKRNKKLDLFLHALRNCLINIPDDNQQELEFDSLSCKPDGIQIPLHLKDVQTIKGKFIFKTPTVIAVVGSYMIGTITKPIVNVDVTVEIPQECLNSRDHINARYYYRRALYLAHLAYHLNQSDICQEVQYSTMNGDPLKPILVIKAAPERFNRYFTIRLYPCINQSAFKLSQLKPTKDNIRYEFYPTIESKLNEETQRLGPPTPHYNHGILVDMSFGRHLREIYQATRQSQSLIDAITLIKIWLYQREFNKGINGLNGFLASMFLIYLLKKKKLNLQMSSYQILRIFLIQLASSDWSTNGITLAEQDNSNIPSTAEFSTVFEVVFIDSSGYLNLAANLTKISYDELRHAASSSLRHLDSSSSDVFSDLFVKKVPYFTKYDHYITLKQLPQIEKANIGQEVLEYLISRCNHLRPVMLRWLMVILQKGLNKRVKLISVMPEDISKWPITKMPPAESETVTIGLSLDTEQYSSIVEMGPSAEDSQAAELFRKFWGEKSELRRFKDGAIKEAAIWQCKNIAERRFICERIVKYLLQLHGKISPENVNYIAGQLDHTLAITYEDEKSKLPFCNNNATEDAISIIKSFNELCKQLRLLKGLSLSINTIQGISPVFRHTELFPSKPAKRFKSRTRLSDDVQFRNVAKNVLLPTANKTCPEWIPANEAVCSMELSGDWPQNAEAVQRVKSALHLEIARLLSQHYSLLAVGQTNYIDVFKDGYVFRVRVAYHREPGLIRLVENEGNELLAAELEKTTILLPQFATMINGVNEQYHSYSTTVRLAKRWISSHQLCGYVTEECIEVIVASLYLNPETYDKPGSEINGLLRFLKLISTFDWLNFPLLVNLNEEFSGSDMVEIGTDFRENRSKFPAMFVAVPKKKLNQLLTTSKLTNSILHRLTLLASESYNLLIKQLSTCASEKVDFMKIFRTPMEDYDVIINLNLENVCRFHEGIDSVVTECHSDLNKKYMPVVNFDPVEYYLKELEDAFGDIALFFYNKYGGDFIAVVWKPDAFKLQSFKGSSKKLLMCPDKESILQDFRLLGDNLVSSIESK
ncbi:uncharacterized protein TRIADDRAFT_32058, partial [Trichoplax adhaerens]